jgi:hypothetical protein
MKVVAVLVLLIAALSIIAVGVTYSKWGATPPQITFNRDFKVLGRAPALTVKVEDPASGLKHVSIHLKQKDQDIALADDSLNKDKSKSYDVGKLIAEKYKIEDGPATLSISATDNSMRNFFRGNQTEIAKDFTFITKPPTLQVLEGQHYINQGGSECVIYRVSGNVETSGVQVGQRFFPGFKFDKDLNFALFALEYDLPADTPMKVVASDAAGNEVTADFWHKVFPKKFRSRDLPLEDSFVQKVVPEIMSNTPSVKDQGDPVKNFVEINSNLRRQIHGRIAELSKKSPGEFLWHGSFVQLSNSKVESYFADRRTYVYNGKPVDQQDHVGFDLSVVQHTPIEAGNDGKVVIAEYFGIYGNAVLIDHGAGLMSLYGHMSEIDVKPGQMVKKQEVIGKSGATGLAAGDHLHFGLFLQGVPVNPTEWWDQKWINDHVLDRMKE